MKKERDLALYLGDIVESCNAVAQFITGMNKSGFKRSLKTQDAVIRRITVIGEAIKNLPQSFLNAHAHVPWSGPAKTRDKIVHGYYVVDLDIVWDVAKTDLPKLKKDIKLIIKNRVD